MLNKQMKQYISGILGDFEIKQSTQTANKNLIEIFREEKDYAEKYELISDDIKEDITIIEKEPVSRFSDAYMERCDKESEETLAKETTAFLDQSIKYLEKNKQEFIYLESKWLDLIGVDAISLEVDDVFGTYSVMVGLKLQKKFETSLKANLNNLLQGDENNFYLIFNHDDGLWDLNFVFNFVEGFNEELTLGEAYRLIYRFLFTLVEAIEMDM